MPCRPQALSAADELRMRAEELRRRAAEIQQARLAKKVDIFCHRYCDYDSVSFFFMRMIHSGAWSRKTDRFIGNPGTESG
jgi:hypothetical protein